MVGHDVAAPGGEMSMIRLGDRNTSRGIPSPRTGTARGRGLNAENQSSAHLSSREKYFLLTFPLIEPQGGPICSGPRAISSAHPIVNGSSEQNASGFFAIEIEFWFTIRSRSRLQSRSGPTHVMARPEFGNWLCIIY